jgi:hypothetical protein
MDDWQHTYDPRDLNYLAAKAKQIRETAALLGVSPLDLAGGIAREMTYTRQVNPHKPLIVAARPIKEFLTSNEIDRNALDWPMTGGPAWKPITHQSLAEGFARSNTPGQSFKFERDKQTAEQILNKLTNPVFWDVGPGAINIKTAVSMLQNYNRMFPQSDPLDLKRYNERYDLLVRDLKSPDSDTTVKIAGLVAREGHDFYRKTMTPERWAALSEDQRAAALTKYYVTGKESMQADFQKRGGDPNVYTPDFNGDGSDMYFYQPENNAVSNPELLRRALSSGQRSEAAPGVDATRGITTNAARGPFEPEQTAARSAATSSALPPQVVANGNYLRANGFEITPRTMYVTHVLGPERAVDLFRTGSTGSPPEVPSPDAATGEQMRAWARALRGYGTAPLAGAIAPAPDAGSAIANDATAAPRDASGFLP